MLRYFFISVTLFSFFQVIPSFGSEDPDELYRQGRFEEAETIYAELDMDQPKDIRYRYNRGCAAFQNSDFEGAAAAFKSVLRRSEDKETRFKSSYNLASTAFKQGDLQSALENYKQAILINPENEDTRYNLELTLRAIERQEKQEQENKDNQSQEDQDQGEKGDKSDKQEGKDGDRKESSEEQQEKDEQKEGESKEQQDSEPENDEQGESKEQEAKQPEQQDLSGELSGPQDMPEQQMPEPEQQESSLDRKKAEALLDNLNEDRSRMLRFQIPKEKRNGVASGKDW